MNENENLVPKRRFKEFTNTGTWEQRKLGEHVTIKSGWSPSNFVRTNSEGSELFIKVDDLNYSSREQNDSQMRVYDNPRFQKMKKGSTIFPKRGAAIMTNKVRILSSDAYMDTNMMALEPQEIDGDFLYTFIDRTGLYKIADTSTIPQINNKHIEPYIIYCPSVEEQTKVGSIFKKLDDTIALHQRKLEKSKALKSAYLSEMFPAEGERKPKRRFAGFTDDWEQRKLEELAESFNYGLNASAMEFDGENKYIRITDIDEQSHKFIQSGLTSPNIDLLNADDYLLKEGDILFARTGASVGKSYQYEPLDGKVYFAGFLIRARIKPEFDPSFIFQNTLTEKYNNFIKVTSQRSGQPGVNAQEYANFSILIPSRGEQVKLGNFFKQLDDTIALHQHKLEKLQNIKQAYLNELFV